MGQNPYLDRHGRFTIPSSLSKEQTELCLYILQESIVTGLGCNKEISASRCMTYLLYMRTTIKYAHGIVNTISRGILGPVGAIVARHLKNIKGADPTWFNVHRGFHMLVFVGGVAGRGTGIFLGAMSPRD